MNRDIRLSVEFWRHPKTKKLIRRTGLEGARSLQILWLWAVVNRPDGDLAGMDDEAIELAADWEGEEGRLAATLVDVAFLDGTTGARSLHGWLEYNAWQTGDSDRANTGRFNVLKSKMKDVHAKLAEAGITSLTKSDYEELKVPSRTQVVVDRLLALASSKHKVTPKEPLSNTKAEPEVDLQATSSLLQVDLSNPLQSPYPSPSPSPSLHFQEHTHTESHDLYAQPNQQGVCASFPPLNGEDIAERRDAAQAHHQRGDYEFNTLRSEYDRVKREAPFEGRAEFMRLFHSPEWGSSSLDEILAGLDRLASSDRGFVCEERFRPGLAKFLSTRMWTMEARSPDDEGIPTPEQAEQKRRYEEGRKAYEAKMAARRAARS